MKNWSKTTGFTPPCGVYKRARSLLPKGYLIYASDRGFEALCGSDIAALTIDRNSFRELMHENPELSQGIIKVLVRRLEEANRKLAHAIPGTTM